MEKVLTEISGAALDVAGDGTDPTQMIAILNGEDQMGTGTYFGESEMLPEEQELHSGYLNKSGTSTDE